MRISRLYIAQPMAEQFELELSETETHYIKNVLRLAIGHTIIVFNGEGGEYLGKIQHLAKKTCTITLETYQDVNYESNCEIHLAQGIAKGKKMDFIIQKAVELGINSITPFTSTRCDVKLSSDRVHNRLEHWQGIAIHAAQQSGRTIVPVIHPQQTLREIASVRHQTKIVAAPNANHQFKSLTKSSGSVMFAVGPEGGFAADEITFLSEHGWQTVNLGPRILRTETAALAAISIMQSIWGDL